MSGAPIIERTKEALKTGKWWMIPWWQEDKYYYEEGFYTRDVAEIAFSELIRVFDDKWLLLQIKTVNNTLTFQHPLIYRFFEEGLLPFQFLCALGIELHTVRTAGLLGDIERRLKNPNEYWEAAAFELNFLSRFLRSGYKVERNYPSGKGCCNCDFKVSKDSETVFIEIKRPREFSKRNQETINRAQKHFYSQLLNDNIKAEDLTSAPLSSKNEAEKVFRLIHYAANNQIPDGGPGIVIVEAPHVLNWSEFAAMAERRLRGRKKYSAISAVILIQASFQEGRICYNSIAAFNSQANFDIKSSPALDALR